MPARAHNDKIDRLNLKKLGGQPLISYTINAANESKYIDKVYVSTEDTEIVELVKTLGASVPFLRPLKLVKSGITTYQVACHVLENIDEIFDITLILLPNAPFRGANLIDDAIKFMIESPFKKVQSVKIVSDYFLFKKNDTFSPLNKLFDGTNKLFDGTNYGLTELYTIGGGIYVLDTDCLINNDKYKDLEYGNYFLHEHNARLISSLYDLLIAERLIKLQQSLVDSLINAT